MDRSYYADLLEVLFNALQASSWAVQLVQVSLARTGKMDRLKTPAYQKDGLTRVMPHSVRCLKYAKTPVSDCSTLGLLSFLQAS